MEYLANEKTREDANMTDVPRFWQIESDGTTSARWHTQAFRS